MTVTFQTKSGEVRINAEDEYETLLFAGLTSGLTLPYECATGSCGTCRARVMSGQVDVLWPQAPGSQQIKRDKGDILMCQTRALGDCVIRVPSLVTQLTEGAPRRFKGRIATINKLTRDVIEFEVMLEEEVAFLAGQFMVVNVTCLSGGRAYSMVNYEPLARRLRFVVKRKPAGGFSEWLFGQEAEDKEMSLFGPLGKATFRPETDGDLLCITGGSGIAGIMSVLEHAVRIGHFDAHSGQLFFGVRTLADAFYVEELAALAKRSDGRLKVTLAISHEPISSNIHPASELIQVREGFVHEVAAQALSEKAHNLEPNTVGFVAGPSPMVDGAIRVLIAQAKLPPSRIRYDKFD